MLCNNSARLRLCSAMFITVPFSVINMGLIDVVSLCCLYLLTNDNFSSAALVADRHLLGV